VTTNVAAFARPSVLATVRAYIALTKPRVISLLLVTTVPAMAAAEGGWPGAWLVIATLIGGTLSAGGANAINCWYDRDIDFVMKRTRNRPVPAGTIEPSAALAYGVALGAAAFVLLWLATTPAAALLSLSALLFYVFVYTMWLKRRTPQNIVIGGAAGAFPPMVGWAAVTGGIAIEPVVMFAIIFMWTPPHFWALSLRLKDDYAEAGVPMLPVAAGVPETRRQILIYSFVLFATSLALAPAGGMWFIYLPAAVGLGGWFIYEAWRLWKHPAQNSPMRLYKYSLLYLALLFVAVGLDGGLFG
jgi:protoheme IX farnesyltransferase